MASFDAVLLVGFGAPSDQKDVPEFIRGIVKGRPVPPSRIEEVVHHYEKIGGGSPYNRLTERQAKGLRDRLAADPSTKHLRVYLGMRNWSPYLADEMKRMASDGVRNALGIVLAPHRGEASFDRYVATVEEARAAAGASAPSVTFAGPWHLHPKFIEAVAARTQEAIDRLPSSHRENAQIVFTAHSIPISMKGAEGYAREFRETSRAAAERMGRKLWQIAYQSRSGPPHEKWLGPQIEDALEAIGRAGEKAVVVVPVGFLCDHVEVLFDLDVEAAQQAKTPGFAFQRAGTVGDHPAFLDLLANLVRQA